jgi:hypothetical protein
MAVTSWPERAGGCRKADRAVCCVEEVPMVRMAPHAPLPGRKDGHSPQCPFLDESTCPRWTASSDCQPGGAPCYVTRGQSISASARVSPPFTGNATHALCVHMATWPMRGPRQRKPTHVFKNQSMQLTAIIPSACSLPNWTTGHLSDISQALFASGSGFFDTSRKKHPYWSHHHHHHHHHHSDCSLWSNLI